jgi:hypothetical protein
MTSCFIYRLSSETRTFIFRVFLLDIGVRPTDYRPAVAFCDPISDASPTIASTAEEKFGSFIGSLKDADYPHGRAHLKPGDSREPISRWLNHFPTREPNERRCKFGVMLQHFQKEDAHI